MIASFKKLQEAREEFKKEIKKRIRKGRTIKWLNTGEGPRYITGKVSYIDGEQIVVTKDENVEGVTTFITISIYDYLEVKNENEE